MPHQCVRCGRIYDDGAEEILKGCSCGGRLFFYIKKEKLEELKKATAKLTKKEKQQIEKDVMELIGESEDKTVVLDFESIRILKPGKYEIDLVKLFDNKPLIYKIGDGKYVIDIQSTFDGFRKKTKKDIEEDLIQEGLSQRRQRNYYSSVIPCYSSTNLIFLFKETSFFSTAKTSSNALIILSLNAFFFNLLFFLSRITFS